MTDSRASLWRNRLARSAVNRKVGGSSPPRDEHFYIGPPKNSKTDSLFLKSSMTKSLIRPLAMSGVQMSDTIAQQYKKGLAKKNTDQVLQIYVRHSCWHRVCHANKALATWINQIRYHFSFGYAAQYFFSRNPATSGGGEYGFEPRVRVAICDRQAIRDDWAQHHRTPWTAFPCCLTV